MQKSAIKSNDLFRTLTTVTTARPPFRKHNDIELDDTAPIPLFIGIGLPVFIGFVILVLICCFCRRRRGPNPGTQTSQAANANYHRAPEADGMGQGAYPMTAVTNSYPGYPPAQPVGPSHYTPVAPGIRPPMNPAYQTQQVPPPAAAAHFAALQPYPGHQYIPIVQPPGPAHQSLSHSSQASSVSGHTVDPLVPSSSPSAGGAPQHMLQQQQQQQQLQHQQELFHQHQQQQHIYHHHPSSGLSRESPAPFHYAPSPYMIVQGTDHSAIIMSTTPTSTVSQTLISSPLNVKPPPEQTALTPLKDDGTDQDLGYSEGE